MLCHILDNFVHHLVLCARNLTRDGSRKRPLNKSASLAMFTAILARAGNLTRSGMAV
jgi:hypothetical protein